jgi:multidrug efflux system outer membrane protein
MTRIIAPLLLAAALVAAGCATLEPALPEARPDIPVSWPIPEKTGDRPPENVADIGWRDFFIDDDLEAVIARALEYNRDLRVAVLNVERARALYRVQRADRLPSVGGAVEATRTGGDGPDTERYTASAGIAGF